MLAAIEGGARVAAMAEHRDCHFATGACQISLREHGPRNVPRYFAEGAMAKSLQPGKKLWIHIRISC